MMLDMAVMWAPVLVADITIDVDGTVFAQMALFLFTLVMLHFVLIKPYLKTLELRGEHVHGSEEEAVEMDAQSTLLETKHNKKVQKARRDAQEVRESLRNQGLAEQDDIVGEVRTELDAKLAEERATIAAHVESATSEIDARADGLAEAMVARLLPNG